MADRYFGEVAYSTSRYRGHLWCAITATTATQVTIQCLCDAQRIPKNYGRWLRAQVGWDTSSSGSASNLGDSGSKYMSSYSGGSTWEDFTGTGTKSVTFSRGASALTRYINAWYRVSDGGSPSSDPGGGTSARDWVAFTIPALDLPAAPSGLAATVSSATQVALTWAWSASGTHADGYRVYRTTDGGPAALVATVTGANTTSYADTATAADHVYTYHVVAYNARGASAASPTAEAVTATVPAAPTSVTATRDSDDRSTVSWTRSTTALGVYGSIAVQRRVDGGTWSDLATLAGTATSYADTTTQPNHAYAYRVRAANVAGASDWAASGTVANTPAAPATPVAARTSDTGVAVTFQNPGITETGIEWQRSSDGSTWSAATAVAGADITSFTDIPGGGTFIYRVRNTLAALASPWSAPSAPVVTITPPAAPTLASPAQGAIVRKSETTIAFSWAHNPLDGSAQSAAELRYSTDGGTTWTVRTATSSQTLSEDNAFAVNASVTWQVRTRGAHAGWGPWSSSGSFRVMQVPQVAVTAPAATVGDMPLRVAWAYSDLSGYQESAKVTLLKGGKAVFSKAVKGPATSCTIGAGEFLPTNGATCIVQVAVTSTSSLTGVANAAVEVDYIPPSVPGAVATVDEAAGSVALYITAGIAPASLYAAEGAPATALATAADGSTVSPSLYAIDTTAPATATLGVSRRRADGTLLSLGEGLAGGAVVTDPYPPVDVELTYLVVAHTASGVSSVREVVLTVPSHGVAVLNFGEGLTRVARLSLGLGDVPDSSWAPSASVAFFETAGSREPLMFFGEALDLTGAVSGVVHRGPQGPAWMSSYDDFRALADYVGPVVLRRPHEGACAVSATVTFGRSAAGLVNVSVTWRRGRGPDGLVI